MHVAGDVAEDSQGGQGHHEGPDDVTRHPARNRCHQPPSAVEHGVQVESHAGEETNSEL